jgi:nitronate monooxygenase
MNFAKAKAWKDIWGAGQGVGLMDDVRPAAEIVARLKQEYDETRQRLAR